MYFYSVLCTLSLFCLMCSAVQFEQLQADVIPQDYDYDGPEGRHLHGGLLMKKKKLKKEFKRKKKVLANCLLNKLRKRSTDEAQQRAAWSEEDKTAVSEQIIRRAKRDRPQGRFLLPIVQYTNVQTGGGYGGGHGSSNSDEDDVYHSNDDCSANDERYANRYVGPYHSNDIYRQLYRSFMRWVL